MLVALGNLLLICCQVALATVVAIHAWNTRQGRLFVALVAALLALNLPPLLWPFADTPLWAYLIQALNLQSLALYATCFLLLVTALFHPGWWEGRRPIRWIALPHIAITLLLGLDLLTRAGLVVVAIEGIGPSPAVVVTPILGALVRASFSLGWLLSIGILVPVVFRQREGRALVVLLVVFQCCAVAVGVLSNFVPALRAVPALVLQLPLTMILAFAILRTRLLIPATAALGVALQQMRELVVVTDLRGIVAYCNAEAGRLGIAEGQCLPDLLSDAGVSPQRALELATARTAAGGRAERVSFGAALFDVSVTPLTRPSGQSAGAVIVGRDVTELARRGAELELEQAHLAEAVARLEAEQRQRSQLEAEVQQLSLPLIPVLDHVVVLPLIGAFGPERHAPFLEVLLGGVAQHAARLVLLDVTGLTMLDVAGVAVLQRAIEAARMLGARCELIGVRPEVAQTIVSFGADFTAFRTASTLREALARELRGPGRHRLA